MQKVHENILVALHSEMYELFELVLCKLRDCHAFAFHLIARSVKWVAAHVPKLQIQGEADI